MTKGQPGSVRRCMDMWATPIVVQNGGRDGKKKGDMSGASGCQPTPSPRVHLLFLLPGCTLQLCPIGGEALLVVKLLWEPAVSLHGAWEAGHLSQVTLASPYGSVSFCDHQHPLSLLRIFVKMRSKGSPIKTQRWFPISQAPPPPANKHGPRTVFWADESGWETLLSVSGAGSAAEWGAGRKTAKASWCLHHWGPAKVFWYCQNISFSSHTSFGVTLWFKGVLFFYWVIRLKELMWFTQQRPIWNAWVGENRAVLGYVSFFPKGLKAQVWEIFLPKSQIGNRPREAERSACGDPSAVKAGIQFQFSSCCSGQYDVLGDLCSTIFAWVSEASDLFLSNSSQRGP